MKHIVKVFGKEYEVSVYQRSKSVWVATGIYDQVFAVPGETSRTIQVQGRTESAALKLWTETARYWGN